MAQLSSILVPDPSPPTKQTILTTTAGAAIDLGANKKFTITAVDSNLNGVPFQLAVGDATVAASSTSDTFLPGKYTLSTGNSWTHISIYNPTSATIILYVSSLANA